MNETLQIRVHGDSSRPTLIYLPGLHGDWTLIASFRKALGGEFRFVEFTYPRTLDWSLDDHARAICQSLLEHGIQQGWLLAESFGSQIAWALARRCQLNDAEPEAFRPQGIILAGGFARHPTIRGARLMKRVMQNTPTSQLRLFLAVYRRYARFRHRYAPETLECIDEFIARRTEEDRKAMVYRLELIAANNPCEFVKTVQQPVFDLTGAFDPIVFWPVVRRWLRRNCPSYRRGKTIWNADHNVLATAPKESAAVITHWINGAS